MLSQIIPNWNWILHLVEVLSSSLFFWQRFNSDIQHKQHLNLDLAAVMEICKGNGTINCSMTEMFLELAWYFLPSAVIVPPLGLPANALVLRLLLGKPGICLTSEIFTLNLAIFDMLFCVMLVVEYIMLLHYQRAEAANFVAWNLNQAGGPILLCILGFDSYMAVCHPLVFHRLKGPKLRLSMCLVATTITVAYCSMVKIPLPIKWNTIAGLLCVAIVIISACNILMLRSLRQKGPSRKEVHPVKRRAFKIVLTSFVLVIAHYIPPLVEYALKNLDPCHFPLFSPLTCVSYTVLSMSSFVQPMCYLIRTKQLPKIGCFHGFAAETKTLVTVQSSLN